MTDTERRSIITLLNSTDKTLYQCKEILCELVGLDDSGRDVPQPASTINTIEALCESVEYYANVLFGGLDTLHWRLGGGSDPKEDDWPDPPHPIPVVGVSSRTQELFKVPHEEDATEFVHGDERAYDEDRDRIKAKSQQSESPVCTPSVCHRQEMLDFLYQLVPPKEKQRYVQFLCERGWELSTLAVSIPCGEKKAEEHFDANVTRIVRRVMADILGCSKSQVGLEDVSKEDATEFVHGDERAYDAEEEYVRFAPFDPLAISKPCEPVSEESIYYTFDANTTRMAIRKMGDRIADMAKDHTVRVKLESLSEKLPYHLNPLLHGT